MTNRHGDFIWYELLTSDLDSAQAFYEGLVGWSFTRPDYGPDMDYRIFAKGGPDVGGAMQITDDMAAGGARPVWLGYVGVDDVDAAAEKITTLGGTVMMGPMDIPDVGRFAMAADPQGTPFYVMRGNSGEPSQSFAATEPREGHVAWNELVTADPDGAHSFYAEMFGWEKADAMDMGPMGTYQMYRNGEGRDFMFGAMMKKPDEMPVSLWAYYIRVPDVDAAATYVAEQGGQLVNGPMEIPGGEYVFQAMDPQGAMVSILGPRTGGE